MSIKKSGISIAVYTGLMLIQWLSLTKQVCNNLRTIVGKLSYSTEEVPVLTVVVH